MSTDPATLDKRTRRVGAAAAAPGGIAPEIRERITQGFTRVEDVVYVGLGILLAAGALALLMDAGLMLGRQILAGAMPGPIIDLLDRILLIVMIVELLYTVQVSFREHSLVPEPFLIVGFDRGDTTDPRGDGGVREARPGGRCGLPPRDDGARTAYRDGPGLRPGTGPPSEAPDPAGC
jgi:hypothetical protein